MLRLLIGCCLLGLVWSWNQPSTCYVRQSTCSGDSQIKDDIQEIKETLSALNSISASLQELGPSLVTALNSISASLQQLVTTEPTTDPTTNLPMEPTTNLPTEVTTPTEPPTELTTPTEPPTELTTNTEPPTESLTPCGNTTEGWRRVTFLDMTDPNQTCPNGLQLTGYSIRSCGRVNTGSGCSSSIFFPVSEQYSQVCGRAKAYHWGRSMAAFYGYHVRNLNINDAYVAGLSFTHGIVRTHIWTFAASWHQDVIGDTSNMNHRCPCNNNNIYGSPPFVGDDYFCESGVSSSAALGTRLYPDDPLWDGRGCIPGNSCCQHNNPPWFHKTLPTPTTDDIEMRMCFANSIALTNIALEQLEIYVY